MKGKTPSNKCWKPTTKGFKLKKCEKKVKEALKKILTSMNSFQIVGKRQAGLRSDSDFFDAFGWSLLFYTGGYHRLARFYGLVFCHILMEMQSSEVFSVYCFLFFVFFLMQPALLAVRTQDGSNYFFEIINRK